MRDRTYPLTRFVPVLAVMSAALAGCSGSSTPTFESDTSANDTGHGGQTTHPGAGHDTGGPTDTATPGSPATDAATPPPDTTEVTTPGGLTALQRKKAEMLTSIWENSTTVLQYAYAENIKDGRGYTSGRAGFCTGTGDAILVVQCFDQTFGTGAANVMHKYMPALTTINGAFERTGVDQASTALLDAQGSWVKDWASSANAAATATAFKGCQDKIVDQLYFKPGLDVAAKWGLTTALSKAALYDAEINHGDDGVAAFVKAANVAVGNTAQKAPAAPLAAADESAWLKGFLARRLQVLKADRTWADAVDRVALYEKLRQESNFDLSAEIVTDAKAITMFPGAGYKDSEYPRCVIRADGAVSGDAACTSANGL